MVESNSSVEIVEYWVIGEIVCLEVLIFYVYLMNIVIEIWVEENVEIYYFRV